MFAFLIVGMDCLNDLFSVLICTKLWTSAGSTVMIDPLKGYSDPRGRPVVKSLIPSRRSERPTPRSEYWLIRTCSKWRSPREFVSPAVSTVGAKLKTPLFGIFGDAFKPSALFLLPLLYLRNLELSISGMGECFSPGFDSMASEFLRTYWNSS